jgi:putative membrane protein
MIQQEGPVEDAENRARSAKQRWTSKKVTDHLANERTFLAWVRTGVAIIALGFVIERFGLLLRELGLRNPPVPLTSVHYSAVVGLSLTLLGVLILVVALINFLEIRRAIDKEQFHPQMRWSLLLTAITALIGLLLAFYLLMGI